LPGETESVLNRIREPALGTDWLEARGVNATMSTVAHKQIGAYRRLCAVPTRVIDRKAEEMDRVRIVALSP
jgi:hypothetical protein